DRELRLRLARLPSAGDPRLERLRDRRVPTAHGRAMKRAAVPWAAVGGATARGALLSAMLGLVLSGPSGGLGCGFDRADRWLGEAQAPSVACSLGAQRCRAGVEQCVNGPSGPEWQVTQDCAAQGDV